MQKVILITGSTDGIGLETARALYAEGHHVLLHGRNPAKLNAASEALTGLGGDGRVESYLADLSSMAEVEALACEVSENRDRLDVVINNAGVFRTTNGATSDGVDVRFAVNTFAPCLLTQRLMPLLGSAARVVNLSSAAQSPVDVGALTGQTKIPDQFDAYAQSKLALTMWTRAMADLHKDRGPVFVAVNPGSLLSTRMVKEGFGTAGNDIGIGVDILVRAALSDEFADASGKYFDNDRGQFTAPHPDALDPQKSEEVTSAIEAALGTMSTSS